MTKGEYDKKRRQALFDKYEFLKPTDLRNGLMSFGFECGDGWLKILEDLFKEIDKIESKLDNFRVIQVKEKFGGLRVYVSNYNEQIERAIKKAEKRSYKTCEICGEKGYNRENGLWWKTTCEECFKKWKEDKI